MTSARGHRLTHTLATTMHELHAPSLRARWLALASILIASCGSKSPEQLVLDEPADMTATELPCLVARGETLFDGMEPLTTEMRGGPTVCERVLDLYLRAHPDEKIVAVLPIEVPPDSPNPRGSQAGTQRLIVVHTQGPGPWARARDLTVESRLCAIDDRPRMQVGPQHCLEPLRAGLALERGHAALGHGLTRILVPITDGEDSPKFGLAPGTTAILWLRELPRETAK